MREMREILRELREYGSASYYYYDGEYQRCISFWITDDGRGIIEYSSQYSPPHETTIYAWVTEKSETGEVVEILARFLSEVLEILERKEEAYKKVREKVEEILTTL